MWVTNSAGVFDIQADETEGLHRSVNSKWVGYGGGATEIIEQRISCVMRICPDRGRLGTTLNGLHVGMDL